LDGDGSEGSGRDVLAQAERAEVGAKEVDAGDGRDREADGDVGLNESRSGDVNKGSWEERCEQW
jgi:hypothetical protein